MDTLMEMVLRNKETYRSLIIDLMINHRKIKSELLRVIVKSIPYRYPLFEGVETKRHIQN